MEQKDSALAGRFDEKTLKRAEVCLKKCTLCKLGRKKEKGLFNSMVKLEARLKFCPWCRAYEKVYGVPAYISPPES